MAAGNVRAQLNVGGTASVVEERSAQQEDALRAISQACWDELAEKSDARRPQTRGRTSRQRRMQQVSEGRVSDASTNQHCTDRPSLRDGEANGNVGGSSARAAASKCDEEDWLNLVRGGFFFSFAEDLSLTCRPSA